MEISRLFNQIILAGGTTAQLAPVSTADIWRWMDRFAGQNSWHVAVDGPDIVGFQFAEPHPDLPSEAADIASYVRVGATGMGIGSMLFSATRIKTAELGYRWLNASIRADNSGGLAYYASCGFRAYLTDPDACLPDGTKVGKVHKRLDL